MLWTPNNFPGVGSHNNKANGKEYKEVRCGVDRAAGGAGGTDGAGGDNENLSSNCEPAGDS